MPVSRCLARRSSSGDDNWRGASGRSVRGVAARLVISGRSRSAQRLSGAGRDGFSSIARTKGGSGGGSWGRNDGDGFGPGPVDSAPPHNFNLEGGGPVGCGQPPGGGRSRTCTCHKKKCSVGEQENEPSGGWAAGAHPDGRGMGRGGGADRSNMEGWPWAVGEGREGD